MNNPWCYYGGRGREKIDVGYVATPFPGYHAAPYREGARGKWEMYDGVRIWFEQDRLHFSPQTMDAMRAELTRQKRIKWAKTAGIGGAALLLLYKVFG